jgi:hypothetical protein
VLNLRATSNFMLGFYGFLDRTSKGRDEGDPPETWSEYRTPITQVRRG